MKVSIFRPLVVFTYLFFIFVFALSSSYSSNEKMDTLTLSYSKQPVFGLIFIADGKGFFAEEGINVKFKEVTFGREAIKDVLSGNADLATAYEGPFVSNIMEGKKLKTICSLSQTHHNLFIMYRKDKNLNLPQDLVGKKVIVTPKTSEDIFLHNYLTGNGIEDTQLTYIDVVEPEIEKNLSEGTADVAIIWNHLYHKLKEEQPDTYNFISSTIYKQHTLIIGTPDYFSKNTDLVQRFTNALNKANNFAKEHPDEAATIVEKYLYDEPNGKLKAYWEDLGIDLSLSNTLLDLLVRETMWMESSGYTDGNTKNINIRDFVDPQFLNNSNPELVTI